MPMNIGEAVKERILELCNERDISINKLSSMSGVTQSTVNNIVSGRNRSATVSTIKKLCDGQEITLRISSIQSCSEIWNKKFNKNNPPASIFRYFSESPFRIKPAYATESL